MIASHVTGLIALAAVLALWVGVQNAWRRAFPGASGDADVLAGRVGCRGCDREEACARRSIEGPPREEERT
jgi:hypothetical protein